MAWKKGPLPKNSWDWGGVIAVGEGDPSSGFCFADFCGDHVVTVPDGKVLKAEEVGWYDNCLKCTTPQGVRVGSTNAKGT